MPRSDADHVLAMAQFLSAKKNAVLNSDRHVDIIRAVNKVITGHKCFAEQPERKRPSTDHSKRNNNTSHNRNRHAAIQADSPSHRVPEPRAYRAPALINGSQDRVVQGMLNKLTEQNIEKIAQRLLEYAELLSDSTQIVDAVIEKLYQQSKYVELFIQLLKALHFKYPTIVTTCVDAFVTGFTGSFHANMKSLDTPQPSPQLQYDDYCAYIKARTLFTDKFKAVIWLDIAFYDRCLLKSKLFECVLQASTHDVTEQTSTIIAMCVSHILFEGYNCDIVPGYKSEWHKPYFRKFLDQVYKSMSLMCHEDPNPKRDSTLPTFVYFKWKEFEKRIQDDLENAPKDKSQWLNTSKHC